MSETETEASTTSQATSSDVPASVSTENAANVEMATTAADDDAEPLKKRAKLEDVAPEQHDELEHRLGGILSCDVCLDLPNAAIYQCPNGHLMCAGCFTHVLADARLRDETGTCPTCRVEISKTAASRNLAAEKAVSELRSKCQFCNQKFPRNHLDRHEEKYCEERITRCKYSRIGCPWRGPIHEEEQHEDNCAHPKRTGAEVMDALVVIDQENEEAKKLFNSIFDLLSYEKIIFNDLQMKPYRTDEFVHKLYYETSRFSAFNHQWVVKARVNNNQRDPTQSTERTLTYQLILKSKTASPFTIHFVILKGPFGDMKVKPCIYKFDYKENEIESPYVLLPLPDNAECNRLLSLKVINFRLIMFFSFK